MIPFSKYHGAGNDFILIDARSLSFEDPAQMARRLCDRRHGIGADGLILLCASSVADYKMRIFNADGSEPAMCGNGIRCLYDFIGIPTELKIETLSGILTCRRVGDEIAVNMGAPRILHESPIFVVDTGVPHAVLFVDNLNAVDVLRQGAAIRFDPRFSPGGVNVNFAAIDSEGRLSLRTYERGVEGETLACGTGAAATAFLAMKQRGLTSMAAHTRLSFETFSYHPHLRFQLSEGSIEMLGQAQEVFKGLI